MKWLLLLNLLAVVPAWATTCNCEVFAVAPLAATRRIEVFQLGEFKTNYYGDYLTESQDSCRKDCRVSAMSNYDASYLREKLAPWTDQLVSAGQLGRNCTGPTDIKIPVRVRARIGSVSLGLAHETMVFIHRDRACF
jgi:hypothetical protein